MATETERSIMVTAAAAANLKEISRRSGKANLAGLFASRVALQSAPTTTTHFISSGPFPNHYLDMLSTPTKLYARAKALWEADGDVFPYTQTQITNQLAKVEVHDGFTTVLVNGMPVIVPETPHEWLARLGRQMAQVALPT